MPVAGYYIYEGASTSSPAQIGVIQAPGVSYPVPGLKIGITYTFEVTAYNKAGPGPAVSVTYTPGAQTISFGQPPGLVVGQRASLSASASSELPVSFASGTPGVCTVSGSVVTAVAAGTCTITASQAGGQGFAPAQGVTQSFQVSPAAQTISFGQPPGLVVGQRASLSASASSKLPVSFASGTPGVCTVSGSVVTAVAAGTCTITASQAGGQGFAPAQSVTQSLQVGAGPWRRIILLAAAALAIMIAGVTLMVHRRRLRARHPLAESVRAEPQAGPPDAVTVRATGPDATHTVRVEPCPGDSEMTMEEVRP